MDVSFKGKRALVTGAGKGFGRDIARALHEAGCITYALSRTQADLDSLQKDYPGINIICTDLSSWTGTRAALASLADIDLLVNNAGTHRFTSVLDVTEEDYDDIMDVNVKAIVNVTQIIARGMVDRQTGGAIVNISSTGSIKGAVSDNYIYHTSKGAVDQLTRCMAVGLGEYQIRVNSVHPTLVPSTPMGSYFNQLRAAGPSATPRRVPMGRYPEIKDVTNLVLYLLSDKADIVSGAMVPVDGGKWCT